MVTRKGLLLLAGLVLLLCLIAPAPGALAHEGDDCHMPGVHTIREGAPLCVELSIIRTTRGRMVEWIQGISASVSIVDADGNTVVLNDSGAWRPIETIDAGDLPVHCPMPTVAEGFWEYSPNSLSLAPGTYTVLLTVTVERPIVGSLHMCGESPGGPPPVTEPGTNGPFPFWVINVE